MRGTVPSLPQGDIAGTALTCSDVTVNDAGTELTVTVGKQVVKRRLTNSTAVLAVLIYDVSAQRYVTTGTHEVGPVGDTYVRGATTTLPAASTAPTVLQWVVPDALLRVTPATIPMTVSVFGNGLLSDSSDGAGIP